MSYRTLVNVPSSRLLTAALKCKNEFFDIDRHIHSCFFGACTITREWTLWEEKAKKIRKTGWVCCGRDHKKSNRKEEWKRSRKPESDWGRMYGSNELFFVQYFSHKPVEQISLFFSAFSIKWLCTTQKLILQQLDFEWILESIGDTFLIRYFFDDSSGPSDAQFCFCVTFRNRNLQEILLS